MARKQEGEPSVPEAAKPAYDAIVGLTDRFCQAHLTHEYQMLWRPRMNSDPTPKRKMSEMISEMAAPFISGGKTPEEKHRRLTAACSAWNMACGSPEVRRQQLEQYIQGYKRFNPATTPGDLANVRKVMVSLMERKLEMFPEDKRQIVSARIVMVGKDYRIEVASATL